MKLLVDENLAPALAESLSDLFPGSLHVTSVGLGSTPDAVIWEYARTNRFTLLTKDKDFAGLSLALGPPPKVVLLQTGNCLTSQIERMIRSNAVRFSEVESDGPGDEKARLLQDFLEFWTRCAATHEPHQHERVMSREHRERKSKIRKRAEAGEPSPATRFAGIPARRRQVPVKVNVPGYLQEISLQFGCAMLL